MHKTTMNARYMDDNSEMILFTVRLFFMMYASFLRLFELPVEIVEPCSSIVEYLETWESLRRKEI